MFQGLITGDGAADVVGHILPECTSANRPGHHIRAVEAEGGRIADGFGNTACHWIHIPIQGSIVVSQDCAAALNPSLEGFTG